MAVALVSTSTSGTTDAQTASRTVPVPAGATSAHVVVIDLEIWLDTPTDPTITWPTGFVQIGYVESATDGYTRLYRARSVDPTVGQSGGNYPMSWSGSYWNQAQASLWSGVDQTTPLDVATATAVTGATTAHAACALTTATAGCGMLFGEANENSATSTAPTGYTERQDANYLKTNTKIAGSAGSESISGGSLSTSTVKVGLLTALRPAGAGGSNLTQTPSDAEGLTDVVALALSAAVSDNANPSDVASPMLFQENQETVFLADFVALTVNGARIDPEGLSDSTTVAMVWGQAPTDTEALTDSTTLAVSYNPSLVDAEVLTDVVSQIKASAQAPTDDAGITDSVSVLKSGTGDLSVADGEDLTDTVSATLSAVRAPADPAGTSDSAALQVGLPRADSESLSDAAGMSLDRSVADVAGLVDSVFIEITTANPLADSLGLTDQVMISLELEILDQIALDDATQGLPAAEVRDLTLVGYIEPGRFSGTIAPGRFSGTLEPGRWKGSVEW